MPAEPCKEIMKIYISEGSTTSNTPSRRKVWLKIYGGLTLSIVIFVGIKASEVYREKIQILRPPPFDPNPFYSDNYSYHAKT